MPVDKALKRFVMHKHRFGDILGLETAYLKLDATNSPVSGTLTFAKNSASNTSAIEFKNTQAGGRADIVWFGDDGTKISKISSHLLTDGDSDQTHWQIYTTQADKTTWLNRFDIQAQSNTPVAQFNNVSRLQVVSTGSAVASRLWLLRQAVSTDTAGGDNDNGFLFEKRASSGSQIQDVASAGAALIDFDPMPLDTTSAASFRFFRNTNTSGTVSFTVYSGNNTATVQHFFNAKSNSYVNLQAGNFGIGNSSPSQKLHVTGSARITGGIYDSANSIGTNGYLLSSTGTGIGWLTPAQGRTALGLDAAGAGDIWVEKAGDTMTGDLTFNKTTPAIRTSAGQNLSLIPAGTQLTSIGDVDTNDYLAEYTNVCFGGTVSDSGPTIGAEGSDKAFDGNFLTTKWLISATTAWIQYRFGGSQQHIVTKYTITSGNDDPTRDPKNWTLQGSNDGSTWTTLDTRTGETFASRNLTQAYTLSNTTAYEYYRIDITLNNGSASIIQLSEIEFLVQTSSNGDLFVSGRCEVARLSYFRDTVSLDDILILNSLNGAQPYAISAEEIAGDGRLAFVDTLGGDSRYWYDSSTGTTGFSIAEGGTERVYLGTEGGDFMFESKDSFGIKFRTQGYAERFKIDQWGSITINDLGFSVNVRIEGENDENLLFTSGSTDKVGIGTASPNSKLEVVGTVQADGLRLDLTPTSETITPTHTITVSINGTDYKIPIRAA